MAILPKLVLVMIYLYPLQTIRQGLLREWVEVQKGNEKKSIFTEKKLCKIFTSYFFFREIAQFFCVYMIHFELWVVKLQKKNIQTSNMILASFFYLRLSFFNRTPSIGRSRGSLSSKQILIGYQAINLFFGRITYQTTTS